MSSGYRKLGRPTDQRIAMLRGLTTEVLKHGKVQTTLYRAKETQKLVDKMITLGKKGDLHARRQALSYIYDKDVVHELFAEIAPKYANRNGGYTRVLKLPARRGDGAEMAIISLVED
ncbi:MAG: 50S ribosomal protein L17 [Eubacteriaceae bacterium]|nr:50S ribosomal protein L17 [Eubacteriaceae bacterium]